MNLPVNDALPFQATGLADFSHLRGFLAPAVEGADTAPDVFQSIDWFEHLAAHGFVEALQPWLLGVDGPCAAGRFVLPLLRSGGGLRGLSNYYSSLFGAAGCATPDQAAWGALADAVRRDPAGAVLVLQPLPDDAGWVFELAAALRARAYWVDRFPCFGNWYLPVVHGTAADYLASLPSTLRNSIERGRRRLARAGYALNIQHGSQQGLEMAIDAFEAVYRQSWKQPEPCPAFMPGLLRLAAREGWLRLGVLHVEGRPVAAQVWLVKAGKANIYKLAHVQGFERFSPGSVLTAALMAHAIDVDRVGEVDFLTGDDAYKRDWMSHRRIRVGLVAFNRHRLRGLAAAARHFGGRAARKMLDWVRHRAH